MTDRSVIHSTFAIERSYPASPQRVFHAFADPVIKRRWFVEGEGWVVDEFTVDFREGGVEQSRFRFRDGPPVTNGTTYHEIVPDSRLVFSYAMAVDGKRISVSLATIEIEAEGKGSRLTYTEQGAFLDGADQAANREAGCRELFEALARELERGA